MEPAKIIEFFGLAVIASALVGGIAFFLKQPPLLGFIAAGTIFGSLFHGSEVLLSSFAELGIAFLLFLVGLELNPFRARNLSRHVFLLGIGQIALSTVLGVGLMLALGWNVSGAILFSLALAFSSTIIVVKILDDRSMLDSLPGRASIGILLVQDIVALAVLVFFGVSSPSDFAFSGTLLIALAAVGYLSFPRVLHALHKSEEIVSLVSVGWLFLFVLFGYRLGVGPEIPAILAGISLSGSLFSLELGRKLRPLRDLFLVFFFMTLGTRITFTPELAATGALISGFVLVSKPLIVLLLMKAMGYERRVGFTSGISMAQVSEFSLLVAAMGVQKGFLPAESAALMGVVGIMTFFVSSYAMYNHHRLYRAIRPLAEILIPEKISESAADSRGIAPTALVLGFHRMGSIIARTLRDIGEQVLVIEFDPELIHEISEAKIPYVFGDAVDAHTLGRVNFDDLRFIVSTIPSEQDNLALIEFAKQRGVPIVVSGNSAREALDLYAHGADYVIVPHLLGGEVSADLLSRIATHRENFHAAKEKHLRVLKEREAIAHHKV